VVLALLIALAAMQLVVSVGQPPPQGGSGTGSLAGASPSPDALVTTSGEPAVLATAGPGSGGSTGAADPDQAFEAGTGWLSPAEIEQLETQLDADRVTHGIPGISATIIFRDGTRWAETAGIADVTRLVQLRPGTPFALGSISKTFTGALILQLIREGRLALTDSAAARLSGVAGITIDSRITVAQLLDHTSGLRDFFLNPKIETAFAADPDAKWTASRAFAFSGRPVAPPGNRFVYSNTNYLLLGLIAERIMGRPLGAQLHARFFEPLGMRTATFQGEDQPFVPLARAYRFASDGPADPPIGLPGTTEVIPFRAAVTASGGAGSIAAAAPDVATWARALYGGAVLGPMMTSTMIAHALRPSADPRRPYGYAVHATPIDDHSSLGHSGRYLGVRGVVRHFPVDGLTIAVLTNQSRTDPGLILLELLRIAVPAQADAPIGHGEW
jgi:D-alanyl-D-alanine carboxypeptidase